MQGQSKLNEPLRSIILDQNVNNANISGLQPDTRYEVQVAALTRKGDGDRSKPVHVTTPGGVPSKPQVTVRYDSHHPPNTQTVFLTLSTSQSSKKRRSNRNRARLAKTVRDVWRDLGLQGALRCQEPNPEGTLHRGRQRNDVQNQRSRFVTFDNIIAHHAL